MTRQNEQLTFATDCRRVLVPMATTIVLDTHKLIERLKKSGFSQQQAKGITEALQEIDLSQLSTKADLRDLELRLVRWVQWNSNTSLTPSV